MLRFLSILGVRVFLSLQLLCACFCLLPASTRAQGNLQPLTDGEVDQLREASIAPPQRISIYLGFVQNRVDQMEKLHTEKHTSSNRQQIHQLLEEYTRLVDELADNLDTYERRTADVRKPLKATTERGQQWLNTLNRLEPDGDYDLPRKVALEATESLLDDSKKALEEQNKYFSEHKDEKNQVWKEPAPHS